MINVKKTVNNEITENKIIERTLPIHDYMTLESIAERNEKAAYIKKIRKSEKAIVKMMTDKHTGEIYMLYDDFQDQPWYDSYLRIKWRVFKEGYSINDLLSHKTFPISHEKKDKLAKNYAARVAMQITKKEQKILDVGEKIEQKNLELQDAIHDLENYKKKVGIDIGIEYMENMKYLQHAPEEFKKLWETASPADKEVYKKHVEFTADGPNIIGESGKKYELAKENLTVADKDLKKGKIDRHNGETYFDWDALKVYTNAHNISLPTDEMYLDMLKVMPAGNVTEKYLWGLEGSQLFSILGGKPNGSLLGGRPNNLDKGYLWSASHDVYAGAFALNSNARKDELPYHSLHNQFPVRALRKQKS